MALIVLLVIVVILAVILKRSNRTGGAWFTQNCPHCKNRIAMKATRCAYCGGELQPVRWKWEKE
jgi:rRNA maturation endonuclease Nob1